jgi:DNA-binding GntR family transcriptional regulator
VTSSTTAAQDTGPHREPQTKDPARNGYTQEQQVHADETDPRLYIKLAASLRARIRAGELAAGLPVPSIRSLQQATGYSRQTCGKALRGLEKEGLLRRVPGLGYHVASQPGPGPR